MSNNPVVKAITLHPMSDMERQAFQDKVQLLLGRQADIQVHLHINPETSSTQTCSIQENPNHHQPNPELKTQWERYMKIKPMG